MGTEDCQTKCGVLGMTTIDILIGLTCVMVILATFAVGYAYGLTIDYNDLTKVKEEKSPEYGSSDVDKGENWNPFA